MQLKCTCAVLSILSVIASLGASQAIAQSTWQGGTQGEWITSGTAGWSSGIPGSTTSAPAYFSNYSSQFTDVTIGGPLTSFSSINVFNNNSLNLDLGGQALVLTGSGLQLGTSLQGDLSLKNGSISCPTIGLNTAGSGLVLQDGANVTTSSISSAANTSITLKQGSFLSATGSPPSIYQLIMNGGVIQANSSFTPATFSGSTHGVIVSSISFTQFSPSQTVTKMANLNVATSLRAVVHSVGMATLGQTTVLNNSSSVIAQNGVRLDPGSSLTFSSNSGVVSGPFLGMAGSNIVVNGSNAVGSSTSFSGFATQGNVTVNGGSGLQLWSAGFATLGGLTSLQNGTITATNGVAIGTGGALIGRGLVSARVNAHTGSVIMASGGNLTLGLSSAPGFFSQGDLYTDNFEVVLLGNNRATLGNYTKLGNTSAGILDVQKGAFLDFGRLMVGYGTVDSVNALSNAMIINGDVIGDSVTDRITFEGYVKGLGTFENVTMNGTFSPGLSPGTTYSHNFALGANSIMDIEIGGLTAGTQFDKLIDSGLLTLDGTLQVTLINGYNPTLGDSFDIFDWNMLSGDFSMWDFSAAGLAPGLMWDTSSLTTTGELFVTAIPEPATGAGLLVALGLLGIARRKRWQV